MLGLEMCAITFLKACTLSRISSATVTFYIQNCFYSKLLEKFCLILEFQFRNLSKVVQDNRSLEYPIEIYH